MYHWATWVFESVSLAARKGYPLTELHEDGIVWLGIPEYILAAAHHRFPTIYNEGEFLPRKFMKVWKFSDLTKFQPMPKIGRKSAPGATFTELVQAEQWMNFQPRLMIAFHDDETDDVFFPILYQDSERIGYLLVDIKCVYKQDSLKIYRGPNVDGSRIMADVETTLEL